jgi:hypothetical protein
MNFKFSHKNYSKPILCASQRTLEIKLHNKAKN